MNNEEKELLLKDLGARFAYHPFVYGKTGYTYNEGRLTGLFSSGVHIMTRGGSLKHYFIEEIKPYLRPMNTMTEEEQKIVSDIESEFLETLVKKVQQIKDDNKRRYLLQKAVAKRTSEMVQFYNKSHLDYNGLIEKGLALKALKGMYDN